MNKELLYSTPYMLSAYNTRKDGSKCCCTTQLLNTSIEPHWGCKDTCKMFAKDIYTENTRKYCAVYRLEGIR